jgi:hypothetical protein
VATGDGSDGGVRRYAWNELQWVEVDALGNSLVAETHRGGAASVRAEGRTVWWGSTVAEVLRWASVAPRLAYDARRERGWVRTNRSAEEETWVRVWLTR